MIIMADIREDGTLGEPRVRGQRLRGPEPASGSCAEVWVWLKRNGIRGELGESAPRAMLGGWVFTVERPARLVVLASPESKLYDRIIRRGLRSVRDAGRWES